MQYRIEYDRNRLAGSDLFPAGDKTSTRREHDQGCLTAKVTIVSPPLRPCIRVVHRRGQSKGSPLLQLFNRCHTQHETLDSGRAEIHGDD